MFCVICGNVTGQNVSMHRFPKHKESRWLQFFGLTLETLHCKIEYCRLCSKHFHPTDFQSFQDGRSSTLKVDAIPSIKLIQQRAKSNSAEIVVKEKLLKKPAAQTSVKYPTTCLICRTQNEPNVSCFRFPKDHRKELWMKACQIEENIPENSRLCSKHFEAQFFCHGPEEFVRRNRLKKNAVPTLLLFRSDSTSDDVNEPISEKKSNLPCSMDTMDKTAKFDDNFFSISQIQLISTNAAEKYIHNIDASNLSAISSGYINENHLRNSPEKSIRDTSREMDVDHTYCRFPDNSPTRSPRSNLLAQVFPDVSTPKRAKRYATMAFHAMDRQKKQIKTLQQKLRRKTKQLTKLQDIIREIKKKDKIT